MATRLERIVHGTLNKVLIPLRKRYSAKIPKVSLSERHLSNLRIVTDREAFLRSIPQGGLVAEVGVAHGDFSAQILSITKPQKLHLIDMWATSRYHSGLEKKVRLRFKDPIAAGVVEIHRGPSTERLAEFPDGLFDWIYIDTDHSYALTAAELQLGLQKVKKGGILAGHDFTIGNWDGGVRYGVVEAVHEFCVKHDWELILLTHETDGFHSFAIRAIR